MAIVLYDTEEMVPYCLPHSDSLAGHEDAIPDWTTMEDLAMFRKYEMDLCGKMNHPDSLACTQMNSINALIQHLVSLLLFNCFW